MSSVEFMKPELKTTPECARLLRIIEDRVIASRTTITMQSIEGFRPFFEMLYKNRCKQALSAFIERHQGAATIFEQKLVKMAIEYRQRL
jgi:hypothetical protein